MTIIYMANWTTAQVTVVDREITPAFEKIMERSRDNDTLTHAYFGTKDEALEYNLQKALRNVEHAKTRSEHAQNLLLRAKSAMADRGEVN